MKFNTSLYFAPYLSKLFKKKYGLNLNMKILQEVTKIEKVFQ